MNDPSDERLQEVAERFGTPTYVYDWNRMLAQLERLRSALPQATLLYALKANPSGALLRRFAERALGAEVISPGELERAVRAGIASERILLGGPRQDAPLIARARALGVGLVSLDSLSQWRLWQAVVPALDGERFGGERSRQDDRGLPRFLPRLNPALDPRTHEHLATGAAESKFGMPMAEVLELAEQLSARGLLGGFHVHAGSQIGSLEVYDEILEQLGGLYASFPGLPMLDLGGGFAVPGFPLAGFAERAGRFAAERGLELLLEPGRFLVAEAGLLVCRVLHVKDGPLRHVIADAGMADLLRPALYGAAHPVRVLGRARGEARLTELEGPLCENADRLARGALLPELEPGDLLALEQAGAYGLAMASNYASSLRPAEVLLEDGAARLIRRREEPQDLWRLEDV